MPTLLQKIVQSVKTLMVKWTKLYFFDLFLKRPCMYELQTHYYLPSFHSSTSLIVLRFKSRMCVHFFFG